MRLESPLCLRSIVLVTLALSAAGCCRNVPEETYQVSANGVISGTDLDTIRSEHADAESRCEAACLLIDEASSGDDGLGRTMETVTSCMAMGMEGGPEDPWDPGNTEVTIVCEGEYTEIAFCTGRRPRGHQELQLGERSRG
ncbi:MAG: hypothetical protein KC431_32055, partial [Myxococcales bacterium]|nr:hypothetical protein [Myxococcales bacterium]